MELKTKRLILRKPKKGDWRDITEGVGEYDIAKMLTKVPYPYKEKDAREFITKEIKKWQKVVKNDYAFSIELKLEKKIIGGIGIHGIKHFDQIGTTGLWINKKYWRQGYSTEAILLLRNLN
jgi:RimJ/RimL family protein N-acetyltransferase